MNDRARPRAGDASLWRGRLARGASGFTLVELLVVFGLILVLMALLLPTLGRVRESSRRTNDLARLRQLAAACTLYAGENDGMLPRGRLPGAAPGADDYTWLSYSQSWKPLLARVPALENMNSCLSVADGFMGAGDFGKLDDAYAASDQVQIGWIYWGGRDDLMDGATPRYRSPRRLNQKLTPGSQTLWTCWCWDSNGTGPSSLCPHVGTRFVQYASGVVLKPPPDGLGVALMDGSASFVPWTELVIIPQANGFKLYYQP